MKSLLAKDLFVLIVCAAVSAGVAFLVNLARAQPVSLVYQSPAQRLSDSAPNSSAGSTENPGRTKPKKEILREIRIVSLEGLQRMRESENPLVLDVRPDLFYQIGHIPGALSLQEKEFETDFPKMKPSLDAAMNDGRVVVVYCAGVHCPDAGKVARKLLDAGYGNLHLFEEGWEGWQNAKLPEEQSM